MRQRELSKRITGLEDFKLTVASLRRQGARQVQARVHLRTFDVTARVRRLRPQQRRAYLAARVNLWIRALRRRHPGLSLETRNHRFSPDKVRRWSDLPSLLKFRGPAHEVLSLAAELGVSAVRVMRVAGLRSHSPSESPLGWYCVRGLVVIRVENQSSGMQGTEDRFVLARGSSCEDAKRRLRRLWREYANPYLNTDGQMVSWQLEKVTDVYTLNEAELDASGTEVYSKLGNRRMRPECVWHPQRVGQIKKRPQAGKGSPK
jgi:Domain of unknown function (DUF4288)